VCVGVYAAQCAINEAVDPHEREAVAARKTAVDDQSPGGGRDLWCRPPARSVMAVARAQQQGGRVVYCSAYQDAGCAHTRMVGFRVVVLPGNERTMLRHADSAKGSNGTKELSILSCRC
jgi:hypothetical protein